MRLDELKSRADAFLGEAMQRGADEAEVGANYHVVDRIVFEKNDFQLASSNTTLTFSLEVHKDQRKGSASTNETKGIALGQSADAAMTLAGFSLPDEHLCFPEAQKHEDVPGRFDDELENLSPDKLRGIAADFLAAGRHESISIDGAELQVARAKEVIVNSNGLVAKDQATLLNWVISGMGKTESEVTSFDWFGGTSWKWDGSRERSLADAGVFKEKLLRCFGPQKGQSYEGKVLLAPAVLGELIFGPMQFHISGRQIMDGKSRWENDLGKHVASDCLTLLDDPFDLDLSSAAPYDAEGVAKRKTSIIEKGLLKTHLDSTYTAKRRGTVSTGHAGGLKGISVAPGDSSVEDLIAGTDKLVVVERFSGNLNPVTGDFSGVAKGSHWYEKGEYKHPLIETMIAGNFFDLMKSIVAVSSRADHYMNEYKSPWMLVDGVSVTAS
ncbi:TldD/PmbA family protein [bacterium]|nr:TldD/PmbA family protein [bacterium]